MTTEPKHWTPSEEFARKAPALVCNVASRIVWLRKKLEEFPPEIRAQLKSFVEPLPFEKELMSGKIEEVEKAGDSSGTLSTRIQQTVNRALADGLHEPKTLYLGRDEDSEFEAMCNTMCRWEQHPSSLQREFMGMHVFRVDEKSHLGVA